MDLYEYQGKQLFARFGIPVSDGMLATTVAEARTAAEQIGSPVMVKAQVLVGGRGKAGGIKFADGPDAAEQHAANILGMDIRGHIVRRLWIERASDIEREYYFSITLDRGAKRPLFMLTTAGGIEIEQVAEQTPERLARMHVDPLAGFLPADAAELCAAAAIPADEMEQVSEIMLASYRAFVETDAMLVEINPLIVTPDGIVRALDSKYTIDDNALFRHPEIAEMRDVEAADPQERMARERGVNFVKLDGGDIGTLANGAGLAMSTLDVVAAAGRSTGHRPANFLDVGGGANAEAIATAMEVLLSDVEVRAVLFNVFGGITRCDEVAQGILTALDRLGTTLPIVVRLDGTNAEEGLRMLAESAPANVHVEKTMLDAAARVVELVEQAA
ncbi:MAG: succinyl-CoA synthetase beta subunit [Gaiellales bacterium]|jgi:succinyl-CoA synthetase beta subunit|nr:succinyl-CoA synthetase beta subunit [Gaiellales bacterium]